MKSIKLQKALASGQVQVRTGRKVMGQILLRFRNATVKDRLISPYPLQDHNRDDSFTNLSKAYSAEQLMNSNLEELVVREDLELRNVE